MQRFASPAQDRRVTRLQAQRGRVDRDVRAGFIDDANDAERHTHLSDAHSVGANVACRQAANRIRHGGHLLQPIDHGVDRAIRQRQPIEQRGLQAPFAPGDQILLVGRLERVALGGQRLSHGQQCARFGGTARLEH